ncbi:DUF4383 domain-containing protein [Streptomyces sp. 891-h]|uniref:DUF4383 domain-containing protein n=1 Tax=Streptomyces sp. 891-h TaxID=2720714 RepID=UPI001FAAC41E|nr:DUF4383 domain-containing protein [Streptomyces sp. 891-h]UNZ22034.1 DUF4383 domain-containing protein [Streptomyces sp. 891-h]
MPVHHKLSRVYRVGAGVVGLGLTVFGVLGLTDNIGFFDTGGDRVAGLNTNGALSVLSVVVGVLLIGAMVRGGNFASNVNITFGGLFLLSGFANLALLETRLNVLAFELENVLFSFAVGLLLLVFGMYGRVGGALPHDNPYWQQRHRDEVERARRARDLREQRTRARIRGEELRRRASLYGGKGEGEDGGRRQEPSEERGEERREEHREGEKRGKDEKGARRGKGGRRAGRRRR